MKDGVLQTHTRIIFYPNASNPKYHSVAATGESLMDKLYQMLDWFIEVGQEILGPIVTHFPTLKACFDFVLLR
jgi:hypothetical protein